MKFSEIAKEAKELEDELEFKLDDILNKLTQELGEFNDAVQKFRGIYSKTKGNIENVKSEAGDLLVNFISVCNRLGINPDDLPSFAENTINKFKERKEAYKQNKK